MAESRSPMLIPAGVLLVLLGIWQGYALLKADASPLPVDDFSEYWAAARVVLEGGNPYDRDALFAVERAAIDRDTPENVVLMWNPPWAVPLMLPLGAMPFRTAQALWLLANLGILLWCATVLREMFGGSSASKPVAWLVAMAFPPSLFLLWIGQISAWMLLGISLFLWFGRRGRPFLAGLSATLLAIKPHLVLLFWLLLGVRGLYRDRRMLLGLAFGLCASMSAALLAQPRLLSQYLDALADRPPQWQSPTFGSLLGVETGSSILTFAPVLAGVLWLAISEYRRRREPARSDFWVDRVPLLLLVSFATASYGAWPFDLVLLMPVVLAMSVSPVRTRTAVLGGLGVAGLCATYALKLPPHAYIWPAPWLLAMWLTRTNIGVRGSNGPNRVPNRPPGLDGVSLF